MVPGYKLICCTMNIAERPEDERLRIDVGDIGQGRMHLEVIWRCIRAYWNVIEPHRGQSLLVLNMRFNGRQDNDLSYGLTFSFEEEEGSLVSIPLPDDATPDSVFGAVVKALAEHFLSLVVVGLAKRSRESL